MTYALAWPIQQALHARLAADPAVAAILGERIYDAAPQVAGPLAAHGTYATLGDDKAEDWSTATDHGARHLVSVTVHAPAAGFAEAKRAAGAICDALIGAPLAPSRGHVVSLGFVDAETRRAEGDRLREVVLRFRLLAEDTP